MALNKSQILTRVSALVNGEAAEPSGDELAQWSEFLEIANQEWSGTYDPQALIKTFTGHIGVSGTSMALPTDFKEKFAGYININGSVTHELSPLDSTFIAGDYILWGGNINDGYFLNTAMALTSAASVVVPYHSRPTSLATLTSVSPCPDPDFLVFRTAEYAMQQRGQPEYVDTQVKADLLLQRLVEKDNVTGHQRDTSIKTMYQNRGFRFGRD